MADARISGAVRRLLRIDRQTRNKAGSRTRQHRKQRTPPRDVKTKERPMTQKLKSVDVVVVGVGFMGAIMAKELAAASLTVVGLERGKKRWTVPEFQAPDIHDELKYSIRKGMMQDVTREGMTFRNSPTQEA